MFDKYINTQNQASSKNGTAISENKGTVIINERQDKQKCSFVYKLFSFVITLFSKIFK